MKKFFLSAIALLGVLATGCVKSEPGPDNGTGNGAITISLDNGYTGNGAEPDSRATGDPAQALENTVKSFTVYVFNNATGVLEKHQSFTTGLTGRVTNLSVASQKKVVVFVNQPAGFPEITNYGDLSLASSMVSLDSQVPADFSSTGLFMSGEYPTAVSLSADNVASITVNVSRLTAKVRIGTLTVSPDTGLSLDDFVLEGISVQKARDRALPLGTLATTGFAYVGGLEGSTSSAGLTPKAYLREQYALPNGYTVGTALTPQAYFYVFPNDNTDNHATMLTLYGTYLGQPMYYSFQINDSVGTGSNTTDGTWVQRNKIYTLNVTLRKLGSGADNPDTTNAEVSLDVTVSVADWEGELIQDVEW